MENKYEETLHIEKDFVVRSFRDKKDFQDIEIKEDENGWSYAVINIIKGLYPDAEK